MLKRLTLVLVTVAAVWPAGCSTSPPPPAAAAVTPPQNSGAAKTAAKTRFPTPPKK